MIYGCQNEQKEAGATKSQQSHQMISRPEQERRKRTKLLEAESDKTMLVVANKRPANCATMQFSGRKPQRTTKEPTCEQRVSSVGAKCCCCWCCRLVRRPPRRRRIKRNRDGAQIIIGSGVGENLVHPLGGGHVILLRYTYFIASITIICLLLASGGCDTTSYANAPESRGSQIVSAPVGTTNNNTIANDDYELMAAIDHLRHSGKPVIGPEPTPYRAHLRLSKIPTTRLPATLPATTPRQQPLRRNVRRSRAGSFHPAEPSFILADVTLAPHKPHARSRRSQSSIGGQTSPKLVQWSKETVQYYEGSTLVLSCSLAMSPLAGGSPLKFSWFKQGKALSSSVSSGSMAMGAGSGAHLHGMQSNRLSIETLADYSLLRLADLRASDSGSYTCVVSNSFGQEDRTSAQVVVNVKLKWLTPPEGDDRNNNHSNNRTFLVGNGHTLEIVRAGQSVAFECSAAAQPRPRIRWFRLVPGNQPSGNRKSPGGSNNELLQFSNTNRSSHLDEGQIRAALLQADASQGLNPLESFQKIEITGKSVSPEVALMQLQSANGGAGIRNPALDNETMRWRVEFSQGQAQHEAHSRLVLDKAEPGHNGLYECEAYTVEPGTLVANGVGQLGNELQLQQLGGDRLRRLFGLSVNAINHLWELLLLLGFRLVTSLIGNDTLTSTEVGGWMD